MPESQAKRPTAATTAVKATDTPTLEARRADLLRQLADLVSPSATTDTAVKSSALAAPTSPSTSHPNQTKHDSPAPTSNANQVPNSIEVRDEAKEASEEEEAATLALANRLIRGHIARLQGYNAVRDAAQGLAGLLAERRRCRVVDVLAELGLEGESLEG